MITYIKNISFLCITVVLSSGFTVAQTLKEDLLKVYDAYRSTDKFQTDITITVYNFEEQPVVQKAQIKKDGNNYHYFIDARKVLMNDKYMLTIDDNQKEIVLADALSDKALNASVFGQQQLQEVLNDLDTIIKNGAHRYTIIAKSSLIVKMELSINAQNNMLSEVVYHYNSEAGMSATKVVISYQNTTTNPSFNATEFTEKQYVLKRKGIFYPAPAYKGYELIKITQEDLNNE